MSYKEAVVFNKSIESHLKDFNEQIEQLDYEINALLALFEENLEKKSIK